MRLVSTRMKEKWSRNSPPGGSLKAKQREMKRVCKVQRAAREKGTMHERKRMTDQRKGMINQQRRELSRRDMRACRDA